jgi:phosphoglycolate phosphatase-like HAD superfamily hydrolase
MHLVLFDIDGTLTHSQSIDGEIYLDSLSKVFGLTDVISDWSSYRHTTDSGILQEIFETRVGRAPTPVEVSDFRSRFVDSVAHAAARDSFREVAGAGGILHHLLGQPLHHVGLATGGWSDSARCKLQSVGIQFDAFISATADDAISRESIMETAIRRLVARAGGRRADSVVYIGDGIWDARACRRLGVPFIGIATGSHATTLRAEGAVDVFADYSGIAQFCSALARAQGHVPE